MDKNLREFLNLFHLCHVCILHLSVPNHTLTKTLLPRNLSTQNCCLCNLIWNLLFTLKSSLFQGEQSQLSESFLIGDLFHASDHLGLPLDLLQKVNVLPGLRTPELDGALQVGSLQGGAERQNHQPAGHTAFGTAQDWLAFWAATAHWTGLLEGGLWPIQGPIRTVPWESALKNRGAQERLDIL